MSQSHFSIELGKQMTRKNATAPWLAARSGVSVNTIRHWLSKNRTPQDWESVVRIGRALELTEAETDALFEAIDVDLSERDARPKAWCISELKEAVSKLEQSATKMNQIELLGYWKGPFLVPPRPDVIIGRGDIINQVSHILTRTDGERCCVLRGMIGVGKTAIAVEIAHLVREQFVDGVLWADFRQDTDEDTHVRTHLVRFAQSYGYDVPNNTSLDDLSHRVRGILADKNVLIMLDNVVSGRQIDLVRPVGNRCSLLITTQLKTVRVPAQAESITVASFDPKTDAAIDLFRFFLGDERVDREIEVFRTMASFVGHLPLALVILARRLLDDAGRAADLLEDELRPEHERLSALEYDDLDVRASFNLSYQRLSEKEQRYFAQLGVFAGQSFDANAASYVLGRAGKRILQKFHRLGLVKLESGRYHLHPLLSRFAQDFLSGQDVYTRKVQYYINYARENRYDDNRLFTELGNIQQALTDANEQALPHDFARGVAATYRFLFDYGLHDVVEQQLAKAHHIAQTGQKSALAARLLVGLGHVAARRGKREEAQQFATTAEPLADAETQILLGRLQGEIAFYDGMEVGIAQFEQALVLAREQNNANEIGALCYNLAAVHAQIGHLEAAKMLLDEAKGAAEQSNNLRLRTLTIALQGDVASYVGDYPVAKTAYERALNLAHKTNNVRDLATIMMRLGYLAKEQGQYDRALSFYEMALEKAEKLIDSSQSIFILADMAMLFVQQGMYARAREMTAAGIALNDELGHEGGRIELLHALGWLALRDQGDWKQAIVYLEDAAARHGTREQKIHIALALGEAYLQAEDVDAAATQFTTAFEHAEAAAYTAELELARFGLARVSCQQGNRADALAKGRQCVEKLTKIRHYRAAAVRVWLRDIDDDIVR